MTPVPTAHFASPAQLLMQLGSKSTTVIVFYFSGVSFLRSDLERGHGSGHLAELRGWSAAACGSREGMAVKGEAENPSDLLRTGTVKKHCRKGLLEGRWD